MFAECFLHIQREKRNFSPRFINIYVNDFVVSFIYKYVEIHKFIHDLKSLFKCVNNFLKVYKMVCVNLNFEVITLMSALFL